MNKAVLFSRTQDPKLNAILEHFKHKINELINWSENVSFTAVAGSESGSTGLGVEIDCGTFAADRADIECGSFA
jgi:hypothetical protein